MGNTPDVEIAPREYPFFESVDVQRLPPAKERRLCDSSPGVTRGGFYGVATEAL
jgi:hypothetical protein